MIDILYIRVISLIVIVALRGRDAGVLGIRGAHDRGQPLVVDDVLYNAGDDLARLLEQRLVVPGRIDACQVHGDSIVLAYEERVNADEAEIVARAALARQKARLRVARLGRRQWRERFRRRQSLRRSQLSFFKKKIFLQSNR